jgi:predicted small secreted protein
LRRTGGVLKSSLLTTVLLVNAPLAVAACKHTVEGVEQDTEALTASAAQQADQAQRAVQVEVASFRRTANEALADVDAKLERIHEKVDARGARLKRNTSERIERLKSRRRELARQVGEASARVDDRWEATKRSLDESIAALGRDADELLEEVGDEVKEATQ